MRFKEFHNTIKNYIYGIFPLYEDVIKPGVIELGGTDIEKLNKQYNNLKIFFHKAKKKNTYEGYYEPETDEIHIYYNNISKDELEAILSHELVHKEQHKRAGNNWINQLRIQIDIINDYVEKINKEKNPSIRIDLKKEYRKLLDELQFGSPQEQMAYAMQFVKERKKYGYKSPNDIAVKHKDFFGKKFKKYLGMYWLIKDHI